MQVYTIEVPIYANPISTLIALQRRGDISIMLYGGFPDSPLNGGRMNFTLDGFAPPGTLLEAEGLQNLSFNHELLALAKGDFYKTIAEANRNGVAFNLAFSNYFIEKGELSHANLEPVERLVQLGLQYQVRNGVIINCQVLEDCLRRNYSDSLNYISSCTKYVSPDRVLSANETLRLYKKDVEQYDFVVLTPQHSRNRYVLKAMAETHPQQVIAICNSYCARGCNSYWHYELISRENKKSLLQYSIQDLVNSASHFCRRYNKCPAVTAKKDLRLKDKVERQLEAGIVNFKIGRGIGASCIEELATLLVRG